MVIVLCAKARKKNCINSLFYHIFQRDAIKNNTKEPEKRFGDSYLTKKGMTKAFRMRLSYPFDFIVVSLIFYLLKRIATQLFLSRK